MATQLKHIDFTSTTALTPRPNIRVAFIAGEAAVAVSDAMAKLPAETPNATLDELAIHASVDVELIQSMTCSLIEKARELLCPRMYTAFLRWGETASHASSFYESDEEGAIRCKASELALRAVAAAPTENAHDMMFRALLAGIEAADCSGFGPFEIESAENGFPLEALAKGLSADLSSFCPIAGLLGELSTRAWALSKSKGAFSLPIGGAITSAFSFARGEDSTDRGGSTVVSMEGYNRYMRGPLIQWQRAYARYEDVRSDRDRFYSEMVKPADARFRAVRDKWPDGYDFRSDAAASAEIEAVDYPEIESRYDDLCMQEHEAKLRLYLAPAPGPSELAIKLKIFSAEQDRQLKDADAVIEQMMCDARRFGRHGAFLQTDAEMLAAFASRRLEFETTANVDLTQDQEDAYFDRADAAEMTLLNARATTIEGVLAKLRVAFMHQVGADWSDLAISNTADPKFIDGLRLSGMYDRMAWGAIEDLARIGGVNLAEQGA
ncbi:hypothetical protein U1701_13245 [Sphingomonas sp. PB2P19]|uniref:hypothetical protein n=1 Tax=Sphingomonas rhamnosi TaxID=3096156 RepID=UPI002FC8BD36